MESKAKLFGHPIHQMLIVFPLGLLATSVIFDLIHLATGGSNWFNLSYWLIIAGVIGGLGAAPFGLIDWLAIKANTRAKRIGAIHGAGNVVVLALFFIGWWLRESPQIAPGNTSLTFSFLGLGGALITSWLGGELVGRMGVGVDPGAHLDSPSSLSGTPAHLKLNPTTRPAKVSGSAQPKKAKVTL
jgi:uncharacterized membrane protein